MSLFTHLRPHVFTSHRDSTKRYFAIHDMPYPVDCAVLGHKPVWIELRYGTGRHEGYMECARCTLRPHVADEAKSWTRPDFRTEPRAFLERAIREGAVYWRPRRAESHVEIATRFVDRFSVQVKIGNAGSETPLDAHLIIPGWRGFYVGTSALGNRIAHWRSRRAPEGDRYKSRVYGLHIDTDRIRWELGAFEGESSRNQPWWWEGSWSFRDAILGRTQHEKVEHETADVVIPMPEGDYPAKATTITRTWTRPRFTRPVVRHAIDFRVDGGVPNGREKYGDWDSTWGWGITVPDGDFTDWQVWGPARAGASILDDRARYTSRSDWTPPADAMNPRMVTR